MNNISEIFSIFKVIVEALFLYWWIVLPVTFYFLFKTFWMDHVWGKWAGNLKWTVLEIIPPKDIERGPKVMESIYSGLAGVVTSYNTIDTYLKGAFMDRFSLELVGEEGTVHFYVRTQTKYRNLVEAQIYAQYPDAQIIEVEDYVKRFPKVIPNKNWNLWGSDVELVKPDAYPIRTYDRFEEDITGTMIDPLSAIAEVMGKLGPGQHIWLQYVLDPLSESWRDKEGVKIVDKLAGRAAGPEKGLLQHLTDVFVNLFNAMMGPVEFATSEKKEQQPVEFRLTPGEKDVLKAIEENLGKNMFKIKMRFLIFGRKETFDKTFVSAFFGAIKQFNDLNLNNMKPDNDSKTYASFIMESERLAYRQRKIYKRYKERNMDGKKFVFSTKELATVFHFPDMGVKAPSIQMTEAKRSSAPANLPVQ